MTVMDTTPEFEDAYYDFTLYPENLLDHRFHPSLLRNYTRRLQDTAGRLFIKDNCNADIPFRDLNAQGDGFDKQNVFSDEKLRERLGDNYHLDHDGIESGAFANKPDPKCRFIFLQADHSRAPLRLTNHMLARILSFHQVMPQFLEFLFLFGERTGPSDLRYSGFREIIRLDTPGTGHSMVKLGRSGKQYQLCYNLKTVTRTKDGKNTWDTEYSIRQAAICHQFDVEFGTSLWIMVQGNLILKDRIEEVTGPGGRNEDRSFSTTQECFRSSLAIHVDAAYWATEEWRQYTQYLETVIDLETQGALLGTRNATPGRKSYVPEDLQRVQAWEEKCKEVEVILNRNMVVLTALRDFYTSLSTRAGFPMGKTNDSDIKAFAAQMNDAINELDTQMARMKLLTEITTQREQLHLQAQASEEVKILSSMSQKEAIAMRIITVATLLYLPATFVSTFFGTDVVKYQPSQGDARNDPSSYSGLAMARWLQITIPLTVITLLVAYYTYRRARAKVDLRLLNKLVVRKTPILPLHTTKKP